MTTVTEIVLDHFHFQKWRQLQRSYLTTSKSDDSYRDRTWPLPKVTTVTEIVLQRTPKVTTVTEIIAKSKLSCETSFKNESPKSIFDDSHTGQARGKPAASPRQAEPAVSRTLLSTSEQRTFPCKTQHFASRLSTQIILQVAKMTTVTEIVLHHFQKWRQLQRSYLTTSKSDDSYRDRTSPLPKVTTVTEIVLDHFQKWRQLQRSYLTTSKSDDSYRDRTSPLPKVTTVTEIVPHHFQNWRQLQRSYFSVLQKWRQSQRSSPNRSFRARLPSKTNLQSQFLTTVTRGKPEASPRQARGRLNPPFRGPYFRRRSSALFLAKHSISRAGYLPKSYFKLQKWQQSQRSYFTTSKSDDSYRDRTWPLPKVTTVTEIVPDHFQKWRQLQRSYLTTSKSDDSYRDRTSAYSKSDDSHRDHRQIEAFVRDFLQKRISKVNFWRQSHGASPRQARGKPEAGWTRRFADLTFDVGAAHFSLQNTAFREPAIYPNHTSSCKNDNSHRDRTSPLPKVTTVTEIVPHHFQKWRQLQRSYLTTSKSDDSYRDRTWPLPKVSFRQLQRSYFRQYSKSDDSHRDHRQIEAFVRALPSKTNLQSQFLTTVTRGKPEASPRQARGRLYPPFRGPYFRRRSSALFLAKHSISLAGYLPKSYFKLQKWQQSQRSYFTTSKSDDSYRDRTSPLPKMTTVTEIVLHHFQKWRQLQRSYLTTSKSDDSYRDRTSPLPKLTTVTEILAKTKLSCVSFSYPLL